MEEEDFPNFSLKFNFPSMFRFVGFLCKRDSFDDENEI